MSAFGMERWKGKVAVVTGASSGIGAAIVVHLAKAGMVVVGLARRVEMVEALKSELPEDFKSHLHAIKCDVANEEDIIKSFKWVEDKFGGVDALINNAGVAPKKEILKSSSQQLKEILDINVMGLALCSREGFQSMKKRSVDGHIIHINSILGHHVINMPSLGIYPASKHAVTAITETMRHELRTEGTKVKVTSISPGAVRSEMTKGLEHLGEFPFLEPEDIADGVLYVLSTPPRVQVHELMIKPAGEPF
ncbi:farnesol dehydrogenase-like [Uranotaenia lowii]|uniref:farnesol dehydrogenase-like n=1 Tax=Uranotaenia lowii TaxID=190385 RepID=UPI00247AF896|nr:farnesol dehydrogenase-like [Uranotaenia lowii]